MFVLLLRQELVKVEVLTLQVGLVVDDAVLFDQLKTSWALVLPVFLVVKHEASLAKE